MSKGGFMERSEEAVRGTPISRIGVDEFTEATFSAVLRATEARGLPPQRIIYGIIWDPAEGAMLETAEVIPGPPEA